MSRLNACYSSAPADVIERMLATILHRGPDGGGSWIDGDLALGHRRLTILDLTAAAHQPMHTADGQGTAAALAQIVAQGMSPEEAVAPVIDGIRCGTFLIPTKESYAEQLRHRYDALRARELPALTEVD